MEMGGSTAATLRAPSNPGGFAEADRGAILPGGCAESRFDAVPLQASG